MVRLKLIRVNGMPILHQLRIEEALLRATQSNWCLLNDGCQEPAIVLGISGKPAELVHEEAAAKSGVQLIRRFTGGGTVVVDSNTIFAGFVMQSQDLAVECYPRPIMEWSREFYDPVFKPRGDFQLRENDYAFGEHKFAGNAQAITKQRFVHHTSFLWDFEPAQMALLKHPGRVPDYRAGRDHLNFICKLMDFMPSRKETVDAMCSQLYSQFSVQEADWEEAEELLKKDYVRSNRTLWPS